MFVFKRFFQIFQTSNECQILYVYRIHKRQVIDKIWNLQLQIFVKTASLVICHKQIICAIKFNLASKLLNRVCIVLRLKQFLQNLYANINQKRYKSSNAKRTCEKYLKKCVGKFQQPYYNLSFWCLILHFSALFLSQ